MSLSDTPLPERRTLLPRTFCARRCGLAAAVAVGGIGLLFAWQASYLPFGTFGLPGPGFFPFVLGVLLLGFAAVIGAERWREPANGETVTFGHRDPLIAIVSMLLVPFLFETAGAYVTLGLFSTALLILVGHVAAWRAVGASVVGMVVVWYFFKILLGLQLPAGPF